MVISVSCSRCSVVTGHGARRQGHPAPWPMPILDAPRNQPKQHSRVSTPRAHLRGGVDPNRLRHELMTDGCHIG